MSNRRQFVRQTAAVLMAFGLIAGLLPSFAAAPVAAQQREGNDSHDPADEDRGSTEFHVAVNGDDSNPGTRAAPLRTIQRAADLALPGDTVTVHEGVYRERVNPPRGGESDTKRIVYQAAPGEKVVIKGSEVIKDWVHVQDDVWKVVLPNTFFGSYNPYRELIRGGWFESKGREHHTGAVYLNGHWLDEAAGIDKMFDPPDATPLWFAQVDRHNTTIFAHFRGVNPNEQTVEINVRWAVFYPEKPHCNYITVRGFTMQQAATQWAPPRPTEQVGLIGTHWSKGWIIEDNSISYSRCVGITLGHDGWDNAGPLFTDYAKRGYDFGWNRDTIGSHIVRNNTISHCEQSGITGSLGAVFSKITGNTIHDIHVRRLFTGWEPAGIKLHAAIDVEISRNHIYRTVRGIWVDWMTQGTRVSGNLLHDNGRPLEDDIGGVGSPTYCDLFVEVSHGPYLIDNNLFLSDRSLDDNSQGGAYVHNLFAGSISSRPDKRVTPYHLPHSTEIVGTSDITGGDNRFYNNIFIGSEEQKRGLSVYDNKELPLQTGGNVYLNGAKPYAKEVNPLVLAGIDPGLRLVEEDGRMIIQFDGFPELDNARTTLVTTALLGRARIPELPFVNPDGSALAVDTDYLGKPRSREQPSPGPFGKPGRGPVSLPVWEPEHETRKERP
jgi:alpha-L-arabinofuranosidase